MIQTSFGKMHPQLHIPKKLTTSIEAMGLSVIRGLAYGVIYSYEKITTRISAW